MRAYEENEESPTPAGPDRRGTTGGQGLDCPPHGKPICNTSERRWHYANGERLPSHATGQQDRAERLENLLEIVASTTAEIAMRD